MRSRAVGVAISGAVAVQFSAPSRQCRSGLRAASGVKRAHHHVVSATIHAMTGCAAASATGAAAGAPWPRAPPGQRPNFNQRKLAQKQPPVGASWTLYGAARYSRPVELPRPRHQLRVFFALSRSPKPPVLQVARQGQSRSAHQQPLLSPAGLLFSGCDLAPETWPTLRRAYGRRRRLSRCRCGMVGAPLSWEAVNVSHRSGVARTAPQPIAPSVPVRAQPVDSRVQVRSATARCASCAPS